jgi:hypothetical protein
MEEDIELRQEKGEPNGKIYCANCIHCKLIAEHTDQNGHYRLRVRCNVGKWKKKLGEDKTYKYCTVNRRYLDYCEDYESMGDPLEFLRDLRRTLPVKDEIYGD